MSSRLYISIDIGVKNMAICVATLDESLYSIDIKTWEVIKFDGANTECIVTKVIPWLQGVGLSVSQNKECCAPKVLIERQCSRNIKAFTLQYVVYGYFLSILPLTDVVLCDAKIKPITSSGKKRKSDSVAYVLNMNDRISKDWMQFLKSQKKKDDYTDALIQIVGYIQRTKTTTSGSSRKKQKVCKPKEVCKPKDQSNVIDLTI